jgi:hypothetical protein
MKMTEGVSLNLITIVGDAMDGSGFTELAMAGRQGYTAAPWSSAVAHQSGGWRALWSMAFDASRLKSKRGSRGSHQGVLCAATVTGRWHTMARLRLRYSATLLARSMGRLTPRSSKTESQNTSRPWRGQEYPWEGSGQRSDDGEAEVGFNLLRVKIWGNTSTIYRVSFSKISRADRTLSLSQDLFKLASTQIEIIGDKILSVASFLIRGWRRYWHRSSWASGLWWRLLT